MKISTDMMIVIFMLVGAVLGALIMLFVSGGLKYPKAGVIYIDRAGKDYRVDKFYLDMDPNNLSKYEKVFVEIIDESE